MTLIPELGRSKRDVLAPEIPTIKAMAQADVTSFIRGKKTISGDPQIRQRILDHNEDDCMAMRVLLDGIRELT